MIEKERTAASRNNLTLEQARDVVINIDDVAPDVLISACLVIEAQGDVSERADFLALREILEDQGE